MSFRRSRKDNNHDALANLFRQLGCSVVDMPSTGIPGWPDMAVGVVTAQGRRNKLVECKNPETQYGRSGFNANQTDFNAEWKGEPVEIVSTEDEVIALVRKWRTTS